MLDSRFKLPVADSHDRIIDAIMRNSVVIVRGETGSGKTTQVIIVFNTMSYYDFKL